jgi:hypothetical protein
MELERKRRISMTRFVSVTALLIAAGAANAAVTGFAWREVTNTQGARPGSNPANDATHGDPSGGGDGLWTSRTWRTFDLLVIGTAADAVNAVSFGGDGAAFRIYTNGAIFNHDLGGDTRSSLSSERAAGNSALLFDTYAEFGGRAVPGQGGTSNASPGTNALGSFGGFAGTTNLTGAGGQIQFTSFAPAGSPAQLAADAGATGGFSLRILRVTVAGTATYLGGAGAGNIPASTGQVGLSGGVVAAFAVGNAIPAPGAIAVLGLAGIAAGRRRR